MHFDKADIEVNVAKVSIVGAGMLGSPGIAAGMFGALAKAKSISTLSVLPRSAFPAWCRKRTLKPL